MTRRPVLESLFLAGVTSAGGCITAVGLASLGAGPVAPSLALAVVVTTLFVWRPIDGLIAFGLIVLLLDTVQSWTGADLRYTDEAALVLLIAMAIVAHRPRLSVPGFGWREGALGVMFATGVVSSIANDVPVHVWVTGLGLAAKGFAFFYLVISMRPNVEDVKRASGVFFIIASLIITIGFFQFVAPEAARAIFAVPPFEQQRGSLTVVNSLFTHPALYGWLAAFVSLFLLARFVILREWWALILAVVFGAGSLLSGRRIPIAGLLAGALTAVTRQLATGTARIRTVVTGLVLIGAMAAVGIPMVGAFYQWTLTEYLEPPERIAEVLSEDPDASAIAPMAPRNALYIGAVAVARDNAPLGAGFGRYGSHMSREEYSPLYREYGLDRVYGLSEKEPIAITDTFWPMILAETGVIGLAAAVVFFALVAKAAWHAARESRSTLPAFQLGALLVYVEALVRSLTSGVFVATPTAYVVLGAVGLSVGLAQRAHAPAIVEDPAPA